MGVRSCANVCVCECACLCGCNIYPQTKRHFVNAFGNTATTILSAIKGNREFLSNCLVWKNEALIGNEFLVQTKFSVRISQNIIDLNSFQILKQPKCGYNNFVYNRIVLSTNFYDALKICDAHNSPSI